MKALALIKKHKQQYLAPFGLILIICVLLIYSMNNMGESRDQEYFSFQVSSVQRLTTNTIDVADRIGYALVDSLQNKWADNAKSLELAEDKLNSIVDRYSSLSAEMDCYLMNLDGVVFISSNRLDADSYVGKNYAFRKYFQEAKEGRHGHQITVGVTSGRAGYFSSNPVKNKAGKVLAIAVIKKTLNWYPIHMLTGEYGFLLDSNGVIIASSDAKLFGQLLWPSSKEPQKKALLSRVSKTGENIIYNGYLLHVYVENLGLEGTQIVLLGTHRWTRVYLFLGIGMALLSLLASSFLLYSRLRVELKGENSLTYQKAQLELAKLNLSHLDSAMKMIVYKIAHVMSVERVSIWAFSEQNSQLTCKVLYVKSGDTFEDGINLSIIDYPFYFNLLEKHRNVVCNDVSNDVQVRELSEHYLRPLKIEAMLGVQIWWQGKRYGVLSLENVGERRNWNVEEVDFVVSMAEMISHALEAGERKRLSAQSINMEKQLLHSEKLASIGVLAAGVAHEINNPLTIIKGHNLKMMELIESNSFNSDEFKQALQKQETALSRIVRIVSSLRVYARAEEGFVELVDIHKAVTDTLLLVGNIFTKDGTVIEQELIANKYYVRGDMGKIQQVIMNLLTNAFDATRGSKEKIIKISTISDGKLMRLTVSDTGEGISQENMKKLFDPFFTTKAPGKGTGLGLSISHSLIKSMQGEIEVKSVLGQGSAFTLVIPHA